MNQRRQIHVNVTTGQPRMSAEAVQQEFTVRAPEIIKPAGLRQITQHCIRLFKGMLEKNRISLHEWPPRHVEITPHHDYKGLQMLLRVKAKPPGVLAVQTAPKLIDTQGRPLSERIERAVREPRPTGGGLLSTTGMTKQ